MRLERRGTKDKEDGNKWETRKRGRIVRQKEALEVVRSSKDNSRRLSRIQAKRQEIYEIWNLMGRLGRQFVKLMLWEESLGLGQWFLLIYLNKIMY